MGEYLGSSPGPRKTLTPLFHNPEIWDLECQHRGISVWPGEMDGRVLLFASDWSIWLKFSLVSYDRDDTGQEKKISYSFRCST